MKILFFIGSLRSGGAERRMLELIKGLLLKGGYQIELVLMKEEIHYNEVHGLDIGIHIIERKYFKKDPTIFVRFAKIAWNFKPDIIHVWDNMTAIYAIPAKLFLNIPMINNQITNAPKKIPFTLLGHHLTFLFSDKIISNTKAGLLSYNAPKVRSLAIYNGFDFKRIKNLESPKIVRERFGLKSKYIIGMVASLNFKKDYKTYIAAAEILLRKRMDITFLCIGDGNIAPYEDLVSPENKEHILFLGKQTNVENIMNICDLGVLMTDEKHGEGISNAIMEFNALGKPVIASYGGGNAEIINQGETGYLVESRSSVDLSMRISELICDELLRSALGKNARINIEEKFSIHSMIENFNDVYKEVWK